MDGEFCIMLVLLTFAETKVRPAAGNDKRTRPDMVL
jgi:hypothetical protein